MVLNSTTWAHFHAGHTEWRRCSLSDCSPACEWSGEEWNAAPALGGGRGGGGALLLQYPTQPIEGFTAQLVNTECPDAANTTPMFLIGYDVIDQCIVANKDRGRLDTLFLPFFLLLKESITGMGWSPIHAKFQVSALKSQSSGRRIKQVKPGNRSNKSFPPPNVCFQSIFFVNSS